MACRAGCIFHSLATTGPLERLEFWFISCVDRRIHSRLDDAQGAAQIHYLVFTTAVLNRCLDVFRDVSTGAGWKAGERSIKAAILLLGMLACCRLSSAHWKKTLTPSCRPACLS